MSTYTTEEIVEFFWNGLTKTNMIDTRSNYRQMEIGIKYGDTVINNGWTYTAPAGEYIDPDTIVAIAQGFAAKINAAATSDTNFMILKVHSPGVGDRGNILRQYEYYNLNNILPSTSLVMTLRTAPNYLSYATTPVESNLGTTGVDAATGLEDTSVTNVTNISADTGGPGVDQPEPSGNA